MPCVVSETQSFTGRRRLLCELSPSLSVSDLMLTTRRSSRMSLSEMFFNMDSGYFEGLLRGFRAGILKHTDYINLCQCENLDGLPQRRLSLHSHGL